jgi:hypothetical protein
MTFPDMVERHRTDAMGDESQQQGCPAEVGGPRVGIDKDLDNGGHEQQGDCGKAREQAQFPEDSEDAANSNACLA